MVLKARFISSSPTARDFPPDRGREVAVAGRSNSGKSSAINRIVGMRKLARVSKTPGRTQSINFFELAPERRLVDLPGYGFARVSDATRERWRAALQTYFERRRSLCGLIVTVDLRRGLMAPDRLLIDQSRRLKIPQLLLLTKADKFSRARAEARRQEVAAQAPAEAEILLFSATSGQGAEQARARLCQWLAMESQDELEEAGGRD